MEAIAAALFHEHEPLAQRVADRFARRFPRRFRQEELAAAALVGLWQAAERYDPVRHNKFSTYASHRMLGAVLDWLREEDWLPRSLRGTSQAPAAPVSLSTRLRGREGGRPLTLASILADRNASDLDEQQQRLDLIFLAERALNPRERVLIDLYYRRYWTHEQIAANLGVCKERVSQLHAQALRRMRGVLLWRQEP